jgi:hypothetical protein
MLSGVPILRVTDLAELSVNTKILHGDGGSAHHRLWSALPYSLYLQLGIESEDESGLAGGSRSIFVARKLSPCSGRIAEPFPSLGSAFPSLQICDRQDSDPSTAPYAAHPRHSPKRSCKLHPPTPETRLHPAYLPLTR